LFYAFGLDPAAADELKDQHDHRYYQQDMYQVTDRRARKPESKRP
jgi:hypothetical protein